jgi:hypothetical protein
MEIRSCAYGPHDQCPWHPSSGPTPPFAARASAASAAGPISVTSGNNASSRARVDSAAASGCSIRLAKLLERHRELTAREGDALAFGATEAKPCERSTIRGARWPHGRPPSSSRSRCTSASAPARASRSPPARNAKALSVVLGHASISITFDRYGHLMPGGEAEVGRLLDTYINGA